MKYVTNIHVKTEGGDNYYFTMFTEENPDHKEVEKFVLDDGFVDVIWEEREEEYSSFFSDIGSIVNYTTTEIPKEKYE